MNMPIEEMLENCVQPGGDDVTEFLMRDFVFNNALGLEALVQCWLFEKAEPQELEELMHGSRFDADCILSRLTELFVTELVDFENMEHSIPVSVIEDSLKTMLAETVMWAKGNGICADSPQQMGRYFFEAYYGQAELLEVTRSGLNNENVTELLDDFLGKVTWLAVMGPDGEDFQDIIRFGKYGPTFRQLVEYIMEHPLPFRAFAPLVESAILRLCGLLESVHPEVIAFRQQKLTEHYTERYARQLEERFRQGLSTMEVRSVVEKRIQREVSEYLPGAEVIEKWCQEWRSEAEC